MWWLGLCHRRKHWNTLVQLLCSAISGVVCVWVLSDVCWLGWVDDKGRERKLQNTLVRIQKHFALSPWLFFKATEMIGRLFKSVFPVNDVEILSFCLENHKIILKTCVTLNTGYWKSRGEAKNGLRIRAISSSFVDSTLLTPHWLSSKGITLNLRTKTCILKCLALTTITFKAHTED